MLLRYGPVEPRLWQEIGGLYRLSESLGFAQANCNVYPQIDSTPEREFLRATMLAASSPDGLTPFQIEIAEQVIEKVANRFRVSHRPRQNLPRGHLSGAHLLGRFHQLKLLQIHAALTSGAPARSKGRFSSWTNTEHRRPMSESAGISTSVSYTRHSHICCATGLPRFPNVAIDGAATPSALRSCMSSRKSWQR
jgi:hypothetical protein